ncbi:PREDICTED: activating transcription factor 7-interacting protein 1 [Eufriesea mexicana]|uniref:activating transcription factor 7-interacting protein 1 n=1 Tax=Eufriesea mexicana TaxID=516756 RepID=UPI00083C8C44|nr:PREDICTED: activating transcription factor 7-interacting protein 1 [Eufriesea mexicana]
MMEAIRNDTIRTSDSMHSLSCINTHHIDELSREKEEELLYGTGDDGDEEDALSDDSMRLRLSDDDEIETEDILAPVLDNEENKSKNNEDEKTSAKAKDVEIPTVSEKNILKNETDTKNIIQEGQCSNNDEKIVIDYEKIGKNSGNESMKPQTMNMPRPWSSYEPQWRFPRIPNGRIFRSANHTYNRFRYLTPRGRYRLQSYDYNVRFHNAFLPFERGRGNGVFNSYSRSTYGNRQQKKGFMSNAIQKQNNSSELGQNIETPLNKDISSKTEVTNDIKIIKIVDSNPGDEDTLHSESSINSNKNDQLNKSMRVEVENITAEDFKGESINTNSANNSLGSERTLEENSGIIVCNDDESKDITVTIVHTINDNSSEKLVNSALNFCDNDNSKQANEVSKSNINNAGLNPSDFCITDNSKKVEVLSVDIQHKSDKDETIEYIEENNINNQEQNETVKTTDMDECGKIKEIYNLEERELNKNQELTDINQGIQLPENNCKITVLNTLKEKEMISKELIINEEVTDCKTQEIIKNKKREVSLENMKSNEDFENNVFKATTIEVTELTSNKNDNEIRIKQNVVPEKSIINNGKCDNQLKSSDNSINSMEVNKYISSEDQITHSKVDLWEQNNDVTGKDIKPTEKENSVISSTSKKTNPSENINLILNENSSSSVKPQNDSLDFIIDTKNNNGENDKRTIEVPVTTQRRKRRTKKAIAVETVCEEDKQVRESGRQKRRTAKNAEEIIRKRFLNHDSDLESSDGSEKFVAVNYKMNQDVCPLSPPSLKRTCSDTDNNIMNGSIKKIKIISETQCDELKTQENNSGNIKKLNYVHKFFQRDLNEKLPKLKQEELEELLIQKIVETITMRDEIGKLREQARISERNQEATRAKCQQLAKQIKDFEMVLSRNAADRRANNDKSTPPIKINRSVGLQVNFITDHGMQSLRQLQQNSNMKSLHVSSSNNVSNTSINEPNNASSPRRGIKVRSPRRSESISGQTPVVSQNHTQSPNIMTTITPAALVVAKPVDTQHSLTISNQPSVQQIISNVIQPQQSQQTIVLNGKFPSQINRQGSTTTTVAKSRANDLIDLTDEEGKGKATGIPVVTTAITDQQVNLAQKAQQPCFQRVIQAIPGNVAITSQPPSIRVVQPASQPTPTALVNNMNAPRLAYVMQSGVGPTRQLLIAPNSSPIRPVTSCRASFSTLTYKTGISTIANGTVRVLTTPATANVQLNKHPAPLPDIRNYAVNPAWKLPPPAPSLKISKVAHGIVLSWNMNLSDKYADIVSYQLYAYQEIAGVPPNTSLWKKVGDVRALPLPMACTLTQFSEGNNYYFAVRAVDTHSRKGQYSIPGNISL